MRHKAANKTEHKTLIERPTKALGGVSMKRVAATSRRWFDRESPDVV
jgi:hypothetical protein